MSINVKKLFGQIYQIIQSIKVKKDLENLQFMF